ncbi:Sas10/Utp3/C1D family-domain-containing protein [Obelidium mucronatum]|nr:Sas10/Utp3/C1D family-domain-containing protein [Obelidium mucronatum]
MGKKETGDADRFLASIGINTLDDEVDSPVSKAVADQVKKDSPLLVKNLTTLAESIKSTKRKLCALQQLLSGSKLPTSKGVSLLEVKLHSLLSYLTHLSFFILLKLNGVSTAEGHGSVDRLIELRVVLEKMKPIEAKLKYQIDKVVKAANEADGGSGASSKNTPGSIVGWEGEVDDSKRGSGGAGLTDYELQAAGVADPLQFKPNPMNLVGAMALKDTSATVANESEQGVYRPPKIAPVKYSEESRSSKSKLSNQTRESLSKSRLFRDMRETFDNSRPEQVTSHGTGYGLREIRDAKDEELEKIEEFELDNYQRLGATKDRNKREKAAMRRSGTSGIVDEMENLETDFLHMESLDRAVAFDDRQRYGAGGVLAKRNIRAEQMFSGAPAEDDEEGLGRKKRRVYTGADDLLSHMATHRSSKTGYDKTLRNMTRPKGKGKAKGKK